jgi:hypothetical protein
VLIIIVFPLGMQGPTAIMKMKMLAPNQQKVQEEKKLWQGREKC